MVQTQKFNRILASLTALLLILTLVSTVALTTHHHHCHDEHPDEASCVVCQLIEATITSLRNTISPPLSGWNAFTTSAPFLFVAALLSAMIAPDTLVQQNIRSDN